MNGHAADITVVVPTRNSAKTLEWTVTSLRSQVDVALDIVVVDSDSTDGTLEICRRWGIPVLTTPPGNMYCAVNAGLVSASTPWLAYLNSDDFVYPSTYRRMIDAARCETAGVVYGPCDFVDTEGRFLFTYQPAPPSRLLALARTGFMALYQPSTIFHRDAYHSVKGFDERYTLSSDAHFFAKLALAGCRFARIRRPSLSGFRLSNSQISMRFGEKKAREKQDILKDLALQATPTDRLRNLAWRISNWPAYVERTLRHRDFSGQTRIRRSMDPPRME